jgi:alkanesulfonate monooxygenase SsuD/methylene tetrahydromethanopterin reductase-like flavin-dependent oxidoreductase (luciferase family)
MKVGVLQFFSWPGRRGDLGVVYARALERIDVMDRTGYDAVWLAEHHFSDFSVCPSVHVMGAHVAARTTNLRIGTAVSLAALYHPLRLAEELALLDVLSGGRLDCGLGRGFSRVEFDAFGVPAEQTHAVFREHVEVVLAAWTTERVSYHGDHVTVEDVEVLPKPAQRPHPPLWLAASSPEAVTWAAEQGYSILMDPHSPHAQIAEKRQLYLETLAAHGHPSAGRQLPVARLVAVAERADEAEEVARRGAAWLYRSYADPRHGHVAGDIRSPRDRFAGRSHRALRDAGGGARHPGGRGRRAARARGQRGPRLPAVRAPQPPQLRAVHRRGPPQAGVGCPPCRGPGRGAVGTAPCWSSRAPTAAATPTATAWW